MFGRLHIYRKLERKQTPEEIIFTQVKGMGEEQLRKLLKRGKCYCLVLQKNTVYSFFQKKPMSDAIRE